MKKATKRYTELAIIVKKIMQRFSFTVLKIRAKSPQESIATTMMVCLVEHSHLLAEKMNLINIC